MVSYFAKSFPKLICNNSKNLPALTVRNKSSNAHKKSRSENYCILRAKREDYQNILELMWRAYYNDEPTVLALGIRPNSCVEENTLKALEEGISLVAKCKYNGNIVGACVNETTNPWDPDMRDKFGASMACPKMKALYHFYAHIQRAPDLWKHYGVPKIFEASQLFIRREDRAKGLATKMVDASRGIAADCGYQIFRVDATSFYTAKICERLKMSLVYELPYCSYIGDNLDPIFKPALPHTSVKVYIDVHPAEKRL